MRRHAPTALSLLLVAGLGAPARSDDSAPGTRPASTAGPKLSFGSVHTIAGVAGGAVVVYASDRQSDLVALRLDAEGRSAGEPVRLFHTSRRITVVSAASRADRLWIAWASEPLATGDGQAERFVVDALHVGRDLRDPSHPITVDTYESVDLPDEDHLAILALAGGDAAVTIGEEIASFVTFRVRRDGSVTRLGSRRPDGGQSSLRSFVDVGTGLLLTANAWRGGPTFADAYYPFDPAAPAPKFQYIPCRPPFERHFTGTQLVTYCHGDYPVDGEKCPLHGGDGDDSCDRVHVIAPDGTTATRPYRTRRGEQVDAPPVTSVVDRCEGGHPVTAIKWKGGSVVLDPAAPGASLWRQPAWTGRVQLELSDSGSLRRRACRGSALVKLRD